MAPPISSYTTEAMEERQRVYALPHVPNAWILHRVVPCRKCRKIAHLPISPIISKLISHRVSPDSSSLDE